ncbi:sugar kinase [Vineibacter terrae]|uniref:sugar kinase n=1 Tax=Vineibacter terrae TaxID=2586908 RepID=UPI002E344D0B|nr:sugar kinase [Vineibacter terrae]HEX2891910.1 sugar kinase [Vineibacter terrae]
MPSPALICFGEPMIEFNQTDPGEPRWLQGFGGDTSNAAIAAARQGAAVGYVTALGTDTFGDRFIALWQQEGVDCSHVARRDDGHTAVYFVTHDARGHQFHYLRSGSAASRLAPADLPRGYLAGARILHLSGISQAIAPAARDAGFAAIDVVKSAGGRVSYDTNLRLKLWTLEQARDVIHAAIARADIALPSLDDSELLTGLSDPDAIADFYLRLGPAIVALKLGKEGALVATPEGRRRIAGHSVKAVDATGAGDTFGGAFLARLLAGDDPFAAAAWANAAAALKTTGFGAIAPMPRQAAVAAFLARP